MNRGGFSWKRLLGVTKAKRNISKLTGIPWSRSGREQKVGRMVMKGCLGQAGILLVLFVLGISLFIHFL